MSAFETILYEKQDAVAHVILNRPAALNTYNIRMRDELYQVLGAIREDDEVGVVLLSGAGEKAFCAGADLTEFLTAPSPLVARRVRWERDVWGLFLGLPQPVIAAVHGYVLGDGLEIALCCDLRIAAEDARFGLPEPGLGIIPAAGGSQTLPRTAGRAIALEMLLTGRWLDAAEALRLKLVNRVVPRTGLLPEARALAQKIGSYAPGAIRAIKQAVDRGAGLPLAAGLELEARLSGQGK
ncbi:MAG: enoyl-CoA hydratase/isomerase family protein [Chloroflexota bacterium]